MSPQPDNLGYQYVGSLIVNGLSSVFLLRNTGAPQAIYNQGGIWGWTGLDDPKETPVLVTPMGVQAVGNAFVMCGLDSFGAMWAGQGSSMRAPWSWAEVPVPTSAPVFTTFMGAGEVNGLASVFGLDTTGNLWVCQNRGGQWQWTDLAAPLGGVTMKAFLDLVPLGNSSAIIAAASDGTLWSCASTNASTWSWTQCGGVPAANGPATTTFQYMGHLVVGGLLSMFMLTETGEVQALYNQGGVWKWQNLTNQSQPNAPVGPSLVTSMQVQMVGNQGGVYGLDIYGNLWAGTGGSMGTAWTWTQANLATRSTTLVVPMGVGFVGSITCVFGLDSGGDLWVCSYQGGKWQWDNLTELVAGPTLRYPVGVIRLGDALNSAVIGQTSDGVMWSCGYIGGHWTWYMCGNAPVSNLE